MGLLVEDGHTPPMVSRLWPRCCLLSVVAATTFYTLYSFINLPSLLPDLRLSACQPPHCHCPPGKDPPREFDIRLLDSQRVFYNRVPKCGSTTLYTLMRKLAALNGYVHYNSKVYDRRMIDEAEQHRLVHRVKRTPGPCSFDRHVFFIDFTKYDESLPVYINLIRDPVERIISSYFYRRVAARQNHKPVREKPSEYWLNKKFEHCVLSRDPECTFLDGQSYSGLFLPYFCGQDTRCLILNDPWALHQAKKNIERAYAVVGVLEEMNVTLQVLEVVLPHFFADAFRVYHSLGVHKNQNLQKEHVSEEVKALLKANLTAEYDLYHFALQRLYGQFRRLRAADHDPDDYMYLQDDNDDSVS